MPAHYVTMIFDERALAEFSTLHDAQPIPERRAFRKAMKAAFRTRAPYYGA